MKRATLIAAGVSLFLPMTAFAQSTAPVQRNNPAPGAPMTQTAPSPATGAGLTSADVTALRAGLRTSKVVGSSVYNEANDNIGKVDDVIVPASGAPVAVLSVGGFLGMGVHYVVVPLSRLQMGQRDRWMLPGATKEYLKTLPPFTYENAGLRR